MCEYDLDGALYVRVQCFFICASAILAERMSCTAMVLNPRGEAWHHLLQPTCMSTSPLLNDEGCERILCFLRTWGNHVQQISELLSEDLLIRRG